MTAISSLFSKPIDRPIEGVIKADDEAALRTEFEEYVLTNEVAKRLQVFLEAYLSENQANGVWISGFFGSGKSHLLKMLALALEDRPVDGTSALELFAPRIDDAILRADLVRAAAIPSHSILFNIDQKATIVSKKDLDAVLAVFVKVFDEMCGYYGNQAYIAQFERDLDSRGQYAAFKDAYGKVAGKEWETGREQVLLEAGNVAKAYAEATGAPASESAGILDKYRADYKLSIEDFAKLVWEHIQRQEPHFRLNFFVDEVGQYIADNVKLMTNLQTIAESLATHCRGRSWIVVTAQEEMDTVIGQMDKRQGQDFSKIQDRLKIRLKLTSADVAEVIRRRLLDKTGAGEAILAGIYDGQKNHFSTLFSFADGSRTYRNFRDRADFVASYPFVPYQFDLFQGAIQALSDHNAFEGRHSSVGERSMLGVFQQVAIAIGEQEVGRLATFDQMYEGVRGALKSPVQRSIGNAENNLDDEFAVQVLKALLLVKYVKDFRATPHNLAVLMLDRLDANLSALRQRVEAALDVLEQQVYVLRRGEEYEYLTDEEKEVEQEIRNTEVEMSAVAEELGGVIFDSILRTTKIHYDENGQDYPFTRIIDEQTLGKKHELSIRVISPFYEHSTSEESLRILSTDRGELLVLLPDDDRLVRDLILYKRTDKYARQAMTVTQKDSVKRILESKQRQNRDRFNAIQSRTEGLLAQARLIAEGKDLEFGTSDAKSRLVRGFHILVETAYPHLQMLRGVTYTDSDLERCLKPQSSLFDDDPATISEPERDMLGFIRSNKVAGQRTSMQALVNRYERRPYGWYLSAIRCILAKLIARGVVETSRDGNFLDSAELATALRNVHGYSNLLLDPVEEVEQALVRKLKRFYGDFFSGPPQANEARALGEETSNAFNTYLTNDLTTLQRQSTPYPFAKDVAQAAELIREVSHKHYSFYFKEEFLEHADELLDLKEDVLNPVHRFMSGSQKEIYDSARHLLDTHGANFAYVDGDDDRALREMLADSTCYRGSTMQQVKTMTDQLRAQSERLVEDEREGAKQQIDAAWQGAMETAGYDDLIQDQRDAVDLPFMDAKRTVDSQVLRDVIRGTVERVWDATLPNAQSKIIEWTKPSDTSEVKEPQIEYVRAAALAVDYNKPTIDDSDDAERYLEALGKAIHKALAEEKHIRLPHH